VVFAVTAFSVLSPSSAKAQSTIWTVTVKAAVAGTKPGYIVTSSPTTADNCTTPHKSQPTIGEPDDGNIYVCENDVIQWKPETQNGTNEFFIYEPDGVLLDQHGKASHGHHSSNNTLISGKAFDNTGTSHHYSVAVWDTTALKLYLDDPTIIIGRGRGGRRK
jgi:hypothetical protein